VNRHFHSERKWRASWLRLAADKLVPAEGGSQLVEFAVTLPLLIVFVVGIFDFSGAFTLKQKLTNAARDAARAAAADPINDLGATLPMSVTDAYWVIDDFLTANKINDCGITTSSAAVTRPSTWTFSVAGSGSNGCPTAGLKIIINRGYYYPSTSTTPATVACADQPPTGQTAVISTCVSIQYGYQWKFGQVASLIGRGPVLPTTMTAVAVAMNEN
jgi:Flp pilus assembly protein TadG